MLAGLWTDKRTLSTAYAGSSQGYDVVVVGHAIATATVNQEMVLTVANSTLANVLLANAMIDYFENDFVTGEPGAVKGLRQPDGKQPVARSRNPRSGVRSMEEAQPASITARVVAQVALDRCVPGRTRR